MNDIKRQIIAFGDGGLDDKTPLMDLYILAQSNKTIPKVCLLPTASGDNGGLIQYFHKLFSRYPCTTDHLSLFNPKTSRIKDFLLEQDIIFVSGGHSKSMLLLWQGYGIDAILREAYERGTILSGGSAGSVCWFDQCITDSLPEDLTVMNCLGILPYSNCPHYLSSERRSRYAKFIMNDEIKAGYAADDFAGLHFVNGELARCISTRLSSKCYSVSKSNEKLAHQKLKTFFLGERKFQKEFIWSAPCFSYLEEPQSSETKPEETSPPEPEKTETPLLPEANATDNITKL